MTSFIEVATVSILAGGVSALAMAWAHHQLKPYKLHPVANYTVGSTSCLVAFTVASIITTGSITQAFLAWSIWIITGAFVVATYVLDRGNTIRRRKREQEYERVNNPDLE